MSNTTLSEKTVVTRKPHDCWGCGESFPPGSKLRYIFSIWQDEPCSIYYCDLCDHLTDIDDCDEGYFEGDLAWTFAEYFGFDSVEEMRSAFDSGRRFECP